MFSFKPASQNIILEKYDLMCQEANLSYILDNKKIVEANDNSLWGQLP